MAKRKYELTPEHKVMMPAWRDKWIANAMSTKSMTEADREACRKAVIGLYEAANLPPPKHIVFVPSPFVLRFAGGFAAAFTLSSCVNVSFRKLSLSRFLSQSHNRRHLPIVRHAR